MSMTRGSAGQRLRQTHLAAPAFTAIKVADLLDLDLVLALLRISLCCRSSLTECYT